MATTDEALWKDSGDLTFKLILVGNADAGKTSLLNRYISGSFHAHTENTQAVDCFNKEVTISGQSIKLNIWDTAGAERYLSVGTMYYRNADGVFLVFDCTKARTFADIQTKWMDLVQTHEREDGGCVKMLVGTKCDLMDEDDEEEKSRWQSFAVSKDMNLVLVSARTGQNVESLFSDMSKEVLLIRKQMGEENGDQIVSLTPQNSLKLEPLEQSNNQVHPSFQDSRQSRERGSSGCRC